jgi:hypothetical protein
MSDQPSAALDAARRGLRAVRAARAAEAGVPAPASAARMPVGDRRLRLVAAEALLAGPYTRPPFGLDFSTFRLMHWVCS